QRAGAAVGRAVAARLARLAGGVAAGGADAAIARAATAILLRVAGAVAAGAGQALRALGRAVARGSEARVAREHDLVGVEAVFAAPDGDDVHALRADRDGLVEPTGRAVVGEVEVGRVRRVVDTAPARVARRLVRRGRAALH